MISIKFEKASAWLAFIIGIVVGIVVGFLAQPYVMETFNKSLYAVENKVLKETNEQLEQQISTLTTQSVEAGIPTQSVGTRKIILSNCEKAEPQHIACQFIINQAYDFIIIYAYGTVLKAQQNVIGYADAVQATEVSTLKTEDGEISSWKLLTPSALTVRFSMPTDVAADSVELFVKIGQGDATTVKFLDVSSR
ncbi:hypothetical protein PN36_30180 [Candidatus Thiomargarita nelsonii]|uniref:Uncharacterized protein n=1 Tax=Candidatus Thiomargarita nelsonii TaxID=1003181 RepID=A0A0A6P3S4_9GAMM|nr:hypothetical protein PN36_30180 [Candidatus Thiomargarita nelsonii]